MVSRGKIGCTLFISLHYCHLIRSRRVYRAGRQPEHSTFSQKIATPTKTSVVFLLMKSQKLGELVLADVIDNDSWRVWPAGDRRLQLDKQFYRDLKQVDDAALSKLKENYQKVAHITKNFINATYGRVVVLMGSTNDMEYASRICDGCKKLGIPTVKRVSSAHKTTESVLEIIAESNGLGLVIAGNSALPVINAPPLDADWAAKDIWSSIHTPSGNNALSFL
uniref:PurE domain-containing protein n=1 Tax=Parascaris equorum TaxID=6256 RepID=A0A914S2P5_PAREQ